MSGPDPFAILGLAARPDLTDNDVRAAWRRIAAARHPDRADGGDPARFSAAAAAYTTLRTLDGRREAFADLAAATRGRSRFRRGRPAVLMLRTAVAAGVSAGALAVAGRSRPASRSSRAPSPGSPAPAAASWPLRHQAGRSPQVCVTADRGAPADDPAAGPPGGDLPMMSRPEQPKRPQP